ncbi:hypothetical protein F4818DRAFT_154077 [Hypoxylon cercidicola]|nr:hypothetical protein F4818DRAFT_154077 [Hypoxylon cercidicola]
MRPLHKPLRSVNENSVLLPSPGALESMLKTTTETGDIGIFSIKPVPPSPRPSMEELHRRTNKDKPSSCRDTASEIISMYGSESHRSTTSTLTPTSSEDIGLRSYSMTTCGSRHLSHYKSTATLQGQPSGGPLQRPRSPFPYPTRLKRPGVRPASPALTESGRVDYSRMVEIDRISYRTGHRPYKPSYPPMPRRPPPLGLRADANLSTASLPPPGPPGSRNELRGPPSLRTFSAASMASWSVPYRERYDGSRTSSLTSIVNMYHQMPSTPRAGPSGLSAAPRYYDYTEGFESGQPRAMTPVYPLAPVPTRASNCSRPSILQDSDDSLGAAFGEGDSAFFEHENQNPNEIDTADTPRCNDTPSAENSRATLYRTPSRCRTGSIRSESRSIPFDTPDASRKCKRASDIDLLPSQAGRDSMDTFNPSLDLESKDAPPYRYTDYRTTATSKTKKSSPGRQVQVQGGGTPSVRSEQGVISRDDTQDETLQEGVESQYNTDGRRSFSEPVQSLSRNSILNDTLVDGRYASVTMGRNNSHHSKASTVLDGAIRTNLDNTSHDTGDDEDRSLIVTEATRNTGGNGGENDTVSISIEQDSGVAPRQRFNHKRSRAVPRISTSSLPREDNEGFPHIPPSCSTTPIVSPKPISPARQLKLKNSIPQLMKALPPLAGDSDYEPVPAPSIQSTSSNEGDFTEVLSPFKYSQSSTPWLFRGRGAENSVTIPECDRTSVLQKNVPKLRLRTKVSNDSGATFSSDTKLFETDIDKPSSPSTPNSKLQGHVPNSGDRVRARSRLKLRYSRSTTLSAPPPETIRRNTDASASSIIADISRRRSRDLFSFPTGPSPAISPAGGHSSQPTQAGRLSACSTPDLADPADPADRDNVAYPSTLGDHQSNLPRDVRSMETHLSSDAGHRHGFRGHLPNLRFLLARSSDPESDPATGHDKKEYGADGGDVGPTKANAIRKHFVASRRRSTREKRKRATLRRRMRAKLLKWVKDAKTAVRVRAKRNRGA